MTNFNISTIFISAQNTDAGAQPALYFGGGAIFMNFHSMTLSCLFNRGTTFSQTVTDTFFSQHFRKWELISLNQARKSGGKAHTEYFFPPWKYVLDIV